MPASYSLAQEAGSNGTVCTSRHVSSVLRNSLRAQCEKDDLKRLEMKSAATEPETETSNSDDPTARFELTPQTVDMRVDGTTVICQLGMPDSRHDLFTGEHRLRLTCEK